MTDQKSPQKGNKKSDDRKRSNRPNLPPDDNFNWKKASRTLTIWILIVIGSWIIFNQLNLTETPEMQKSYSQYRRLLENGQFDSADIVDNEFHGQLKDGGNVITVLPFIDANMIAEWDSLKLDYQFREKTTSWIGYLITSILPWVIIIAIWLYFIRRMQGGGGGSRGIFSFGKSKAKLLNENTRKVTFQDVAGCDEAKEELHEVIEFLQEPKKFSKLGGRIPTGALLLGPPGTGKTLLARAVAGEAEVPFYSMSGADFVEMFVGVGASRVRDLFEQGKKNAPCIIFIDEIDAVGRHRGAGLGGGHDEREQTLNQLLVEMDGFESNDGVILLAATNRPDVLDPALMRPGRFDRQIVVDRPDVRGREGILKVHTREVPLGRNVKLDVLAKGTPGLSGADLANLVNEAALLAARRNVTRVWMEDFENAKDKVMMGSERKSVLISKDEKRQTAFHEAGHVLVAQLTPGSDPVHKVTIIPRGRALGVTHYLPMDEKHSYSRTYLKQVLIALMGGRSAEKMIFNEYSTGAGNDIQRATEIAHKMTCEWGMSDKLGPIALGSKSEEVFLGRDFNQQKNYSEDTSQSIDAEVRRIVTDAEKQATKLLHENADKLNILAEALLEREILDGKEIDILMRGGKLPPMRKQKARRKPRRQPVKKQPATTTKTATPKAPVKRTPPKSSPPKDPPKTGSESGTSQTRRQLARDYGVVSSRDNQPGRYNRRPAPKPNTDRDDSQKKTEPKTAQSDPKPRVVDKSNFQRPILKKDLIAAENKEKEIAKANPTPSQAVGKPVANWSAAAPGQDNSALTEKDVPKLAQSDKPELDRPDKVKPAIKPAEERPKQPDKVEVKTDKPDTTDKSVAKDSSAPESDPKTNKSDTNTEDKPKPRKKPVRRKTTKTAASKTAKAKPDATDDKDETETKKPAKQKTRKTTSKAKVKKAPKKADSKVSDASEETDTPAVEKEKPKRRTYTRRTKAKKTTEKTATDPAPSDDNKTTSSTKTDSVDKKETAPRKTDDKSKPSTDKPASDKTSSPDLFSNSSEGSAEKPKNPEATKSKDATGLFSSKKSPQRGSNVEDEKPEQTQSPSPADEKDGN